MSGASIESVLAAALDGEMGDRLAVPTWIRGPLANGLADAICAHLAETLARPEVVEAVARAIGDPGSVCMRGTVRDEYAETVTRWSTRAALGAVREALSAEPRREEEPA